MRESIPPSMAYNGLGTRLSTRTPCFNLTLAKVDLVSNVLRYLLRSVDLLPTVVKITL